MVAYGAVSTALALLSDHRLGRLVDRATPLGSGIGGTTASLVIADTPVFVKRIPLTDLERDPRNTMSTANLFGLPTYYQYGVGSTGFGAWRELAAHAMTTNWVLARQTEAFPLMYHWRVLPGAPRPARDHTDVERAVAYWEGSAAVRQRLNALANASADIVLFLEYFPHNLRDWLGEQAAAGHDAIVAACHLLQRCLPPAVAFMNSHGLLHFDAHLRNILTDGHRLYLGDLGLATSLGFELSPAEKAFVKRNRTHDAGHTSMEMVNWMVAHAARVPPASALIKRYAPVAAIMNAFYRSLSRESRTTPYPARAVRAALSGLED